MHCNAQPMLAPCVALAAMLTVLCGAITIDPMEQPLVDGVRTVVFTGPSSFVRVAEATNATIVIVVQTDGELRIEGMRRASLILRDTSCAKLSTSQGTTPLRGMVFSNVTVAGDIDVPVITLEDGATAAWDKVTAGGAIAIGSIRGVNASVSLAHVSATGLSVQSVTYVALELAHSTFVGDGRIGVQLRYVTTDAAVTLRDTTIAVNRTGKDQARGIEIEFFRSARAVRIVRCTVSAAAVSHAYAISVDMIRDVGEFELDGVVASAFTVESKAYAVRLDQLLNVERFAVRRSTLRVRSDLYDAIAFFVTDRMQLIGAFVLDDNVFEAGVGQQHVGAVLVHFASSMVMEVFGLFAMRRNVFNSTTNTITAVAVKAPKEIRVVDRVVFSDNWVGSDIGEGALASLGTYDQAGSVEVVGNTVKGRVSLCVSQAGAVAVQGNVVAEAGARDGVVTLDVKVTEAREVRISCNAVALAAVEDSIGLLLRVLDVVTADVANNTVDVYSAEYTVTGLKLFMRNATVRVVSNNISVDAAGSATRRVVNAVLLERVTPDTPPYELVLVANTFTRSQPRPIAPSIAVQQPLGTLAHVALYRNAVTQTGDVPDAAAPQWLIGPVGTGTLADARVTLGCNTHNGAPVAPWDTSALKAIQTPATHPRLACGAETNTAIALLGLPADACPALTSDVSAPPQLRTATATLRLPSVTLTLDTAVPPATATGMASTVAATTTTAAPSTTGTTATSPATAQPDAPRTPPPPPADTTTDAPMPPSTRTRSPHDGIGDANSRTATLVLLPPLAATRDAMRRLLGDRAATVVAATPPVVAVAATALSAAGPGAVAHAVRLRATQRAMFCHYDPHDDPIPSYFQMPLQFALPVPGTPDAYARLNGGTLASAVVVAACAAAAWDRERQQAAVAAQSTAQHVAAVANAVLAVLLVPSLAEAAALGLAWLSWPALVLYVAALGTGLAVLGLAAHRVLAVAGRVCAFDAATGFSPLLGGAAGGDAKDDAAKEDKAVRGSAVLNAFGVFFDGARGATQTVRCYALEEAAAAVAMGAISGIRLAPGASCAVPALALLLVAVAHAGYVVTLRPYNTRVENGSAVALALLQLLAAGVAAVVATAASPALDDDALPRVVALVTLAQVGALVALPVAVLAARRCGPSGTGTSAPAAAAAAAPLLVVAALGDTADAADPQCVANPLA